MAFRSGHDASRGETFVGDGSLDDARMKVREAYMSRIKTAWTDLTR